MSADGYQAIMAQRPAIMRASVGIDYMQYSTGVLAFDYERLLADTETAAGMGRQGALLHRERFLPGQHADALAGVMRH